MKILFITCAILIPIGAFFSLLFIDSTPPYLSSFPIFVFAIPCFVSIFKIYSMKKASLLILIFSSYAFFIEHIGVVSGFPYGQFHYTNTLNPKIFSTVPLSLPLAYIPLLLGSIAIPVVLGIKNNRITSLLILVLGDLVIDPGAIKLGLWKYAARGIIYNVPLSNFLGWMITGGIAIILFFLVIKDQKIKSHLASGIVISFLIIIYYWTSIALLSRLFISFFTGIIILILVLISLNKLDYGKQK